MKKKKKSISSGLVDTRSTYDTFIKWCDKCTDGFFDYQGCLSIKGSDGIKLTGEKVGRAKFENIDEVDSELERSGYYEDGEVMCGENSFKAPTKKYGEWFREKYNIK